MYLFSSSCRRDSLSFASSSQNSARWCSTSLPTTFYLTQTPSDSSFIEVYVNGVLETSGWSYDSGLNAVVFDSASTPEDGDSVDIDYCI